MKKTSRAGGNPQAKPEEITLVVARPGPLLATLVALLPGRNRKLLKAVLKSRQVSVDGAVVTQFDHPLLPGQRLQVSWQPRSAEQLAHGLTIVFEDDDIIVVNKPPGLLTVATDKEKRKTAYAVLSDYLKTQDRRHKIFIIHRLDQETSGLLMFAKNGGVKQQIQKSWEATIRQRTYVAVVEGRLEQEQGTIVSWLTESSAFKVYSSQNPRQGQKAVTHFRKIGQSKDFTLVEVNLETGRKHQIRVHLQDIGHPVVGDKKYGGGANPIGRLGLHARVLAFIHPQTGELCRFETPIPGSFRRLVS